MRTFYILLIAVALIAAGVFLYDLFQADIETPPAKTRLVVNLSAKTVTLEKPAGRVAIVYACMFGPGEPVMEVRNYWITQFEKDYSDKLSIEAARSLTAADREAGVLEIQERLRRDIPAVSQKLKAARAEKNGSNSQQQLDALSKWLDDRGIAMEGDVTRDASTDKFKVFDSLVENLNGFDPKTSPFAIHVTARVEVAVERRWQGRWVLSANRPRFLTGNDVPDIIVGSKMELFALVQDDYAVSLDDPLKGESVSPLDSPDTWANPNRRWRDAFLTAMLEEGKYSFVEDAARKNKTYLAPLWSTTGCIFYNKSLFDKAGVAAPPRTWSEFLDACEKLKTVGIPPLISDQAVYSDDWQTWLCFRILGPDNWERTISGAPVDKPVSERASDPPWTDSRYKDVYSQIRLLHERGYYDPDSRSLTWPAAQRAFSKGKAAMMICGSWLPQEIAGYENAGNGSEFKLGCFSFPRWQGGREEDQAAVNAVVYGLMVCRQGKATRHAVELVKYLSAKDHPDMVHKNNQISCMKDADFPSALTGIEADFRYAMEHNLNYNRTPDIYARRFANTILAPNYHNFFMGEMTVDEYLEKLKSETEHYLKVGGEEGFE